MISAASCANRETLAKQRRAFGSAASCANSETLAKRRRRLIDPLQAEPSTRLGRKGGDAYCPLQAAPTTCRGVKEKCGIVRCRLRLQRDLRKFEGDYPGLATLIPE